MTLKEKIIEVLEKQSYLSDRELTDIIVGRNEPQQSINQACNQLQKQGIINRTNPPIKNYLSDSNNIEIKKTIKKQDSEDPKQEESIKETLNAYLIENDWKTEVAWGNKHGIDIEAHKDNQRWVIEVKGCGSRNAMRVNYFLAILGETLQRMDDPNARYSIALPDMQQYRNLWNRLPKLAKQRTNIDAIFVNDNNKISFVK